MTFRYRIVGRTITFAPVIAKGCSTFRCAWAISMAYPGKTWLRVHGPPDEVEGRRRRVEAGAHGATPQEAHPEAARALTGEAPKARGQGRNHHHPELIGLGLVAAGLFLSTLVYLGGRAAPAERQSSTACGRSWATPATGRRSSSSAR